MAYDDIMQALRNGKSVCWANTGYSVFVENDKLYSVFGRNGYTCLLQDSEFDQCFIL